MSLEQIRETLQHVHNLLGDTPSYKNDPNLWEAVSQLTAAVQELAAKIPGDT